VDRVLARLQRWWSQLPATRIKLKLGSPQGMEHGRALVRAAAEAIEVRVQESGEPLELQVDANGGWDLPTALALMPDLEGCGVSLLEQPLPADPDPERDRIGFEELRKASSIPLVADESCWNVADVQRLVPHVAGVNIQLLKSGGLQEALLMARLARRLGMEVMLGCYSDSTLLNGAAAQLLPLASWPDLDSHLSLSGDPFTGLPIEHDCLSPPQAAGLGITQVSPFAAGDASR